MPRNLEQELVRWIDEKLKSNGLAQQAIKDKDARLVFGLAAESLVGVYEQGGNNNGPMVRLIQETIGGADREPWCMALVQSCLAYAELKTGAKSPIVSSEHCMTVWNDTPKTSRVKTLPKRYAIIIWVNGKGPAGHTGILLEPSPRKTFTSVEGNTGSDGSRDGDGVYYKTRDWFRSGSLKRVGFLKPF